MLAYSTVSQLGYMVMALGAGAFAAGVFHLMTHAFFKALLFLGAGSVIHALNDEQDLRRMGGLWRPLKVTALTFIIGWLAIIGLPPFAGFFSKDLILARTFERGLDEPWYFVLYGIGLLTVALTAFYMSRLVFLAFFGPYRGATVAAGLTPEQAAMAPEHEPVAAAPAGLPSGHDQGHHHAGDADGQAGHDAHDSHGAGGAVAHGGRPHESPPSMLIPLVVLALLSIVGGWVGIPAFISDAVFGGHATGTPFEQFLAPSVGGEEGGTGAASHALDVTTEWILTGASVGMAGLGVVVAAMLYLIRVPDPAALARAFRTPYTWLLNKWYVDELYQALIAHPGARLASFLAAFDLGVVDGMVNGVARLARGTGGVLRQLQSGYVRGYAVTMLIGAFCVLAYWAFRST